MPEVATAGLVAGATAVWLAVGVVLLARRRVDYRHRRRTISELGEAGAADRHLAAYALFLPVGLGSAAVAALADRWGVRVLAGSLAIGYLVAVVAPCDAGCPPRGSTTNTVHLLGGVVEYVGVVVGLVVLAATVSPWFALPGVVAAAAIVAGGVPGLSGQVGLIQRVVEAIALVGLVAAAA